MEREGHLTTTDTHNLVLEAYCRVGDLGAVFTYFHDMQQADVPADLNTYHILVDSALSDGGSRSCKVILSLSLSLSLTACMYVALLACSFSCLAPFSHFLSILCYSTPGSHLQDMAVVSEGGSPDTT